MNICKSIYYRTIEAKNIIKILLSRLVRLKNETILYRKLGVYYQQPGKSDTGLKLNEVPEGDFCDLFTVAFNNSEFIKYQILSLRKNYVMPYRYTVFDNSNKDKCAEEIEKVCKQYGCKYIKLPQQDSNIDVANSHGTALNWIWKNYMSQSSARYFGILDHDIFPVIPFDIRDYINGQELFGYVRKNEKNVFIKQGRWYLWPGFTFFDANYVHGKELNFCPDWNHGLDTGGKNYFLLYKNVELNTLRVTESHEKRIDRSCGAYWGGYEEFDCGWIHMWNGSGYCQSEKWQEKYNNFISVLDEKLSE